MLHRAGAALSAAAVFLGLLVGVADPVRADPGQDPWGPPHVLYENRTTARIAQASTSDGTTVVVFYARPRVSEPRFALVAIRHADGHWTEPARLADGGRGRLATVLAWGEGQLSIIWVTRTHGVNVRYHMRSLRPDGTLDEQNEIYTAKNASPLFRAAINGSGQVALAWSNGDRYDRVVVRELDGSWTHHPKVPVLHSGEWQLRIPEPRALFLDDAGRVATFTWGVVDGSSTGIWLARSTTNGTWTTQRTESVIGWVSEDVAAYASNARGDLAVIFGRENYSTGRFTPYLRFADAGHRLGEPVALSPYECFLLEFFCADVALAADGTATVAFPTAVDKDDVIMEMIRRLPDGSFTSTQALTEPFWRNSFGGVQIAANRGGDTVVSFKGTHPGFARCPATTQCAETMYVDDDAPGWSDPWQTSMGDDAELTVTWTGNEWPRNEEAVTRQLAGAGGVSTSGT